MLLAGENLIKRLDECDAKVQAAFWLLDGEENVWKLTIVSPLVESEGPRNYYRRINNVNDTADSEEDVVSLHDIHVANTDNRIFKAMLSFKDTALWKTMPLINTRLGKNFIGGVYFEDMYLYRIESELVGSNIPGTATENANYSPSP